MTAIYKKELRSYFLTPIGYVFIGIFLLIGGVLFTGTNLLNGIGDMRYLFGNIWLMLSFVLLIPVLTMRTLAEEKNAKTDQLLLTAPISVSSIVIGKVLAAITVYTIALVIMLLYPIIMSFFTTLAWGEVIGNYIGYFLMGAAFVSIGVYISSLTENQLIAAVSTFGILLALFLIDMFSGVINQPILKVIVEWISVNRQFYDFTSGIIKLESVIYYLSIVALFTFLTVRHIENRRWSK